jgi:hypothetical protein
MSDGSVERGEGITFTLGRQRQTAGSAWYRGDVCNFNPAVPNMRRYDAIERFILHGLLPPEPFVTGETRITAIGSCFAQNISEYLGSRRYRVLTREESRSHLVTIGEGLVNTYALRQQFEWAFDGKTPSGQLWFGWNAEEYGCDEETRLATRSIFERTDLFVITLGLSEVWYDNVTQEVFWRAVPADVYDADRHRFRVTSVAENKANISEIMALIRKYRPESRVVFTLSPIPLVATFRPVSCLTANSVSKAVLRAALDEVLREADDPRIFYWPAYEIVQEAFGTGKWWDDRRHVAPAVIAHVMRLFEASYCAETVAAKSVARSLAEARAAVGELAADALAAVDGGPAEVATLVGRYLASGDPETAELLLRIALERSPADLELNGLQARIAALPPADLTDRRLLVEETNERFGA